MWQWWRKRGTTSKMLQADRPFYSGAPCRRCCSEHSTCLRCIQPRVSCSCCLCVSDLFDVRGRTGAGICIAYNIVHSIMGMGKVFWTQLQHIMRIHQHAPTAANKKLLLTALTKCLECFSKISTGAQPTAYPGPRPSKEQIAEAGSYVEPLCQEQRRLSRLVAQ